MPHLNEAIDFDQFEELPATLGKCSGWSATGRCRNQTQVGQSRRDLDKSASEQLRLPLVISLDFVCSMFVLSSAPRRDSTPLVGSEGRRVRASKVRRPHK
jgi:hypothetical protein